MDGVKSANAKTKQAKEYNIETYWITKPRSQRKQSLSQDLLQDLKSRLTDGADATTRSQKIAQETHTHLKDASVHNLDADQGDIEARYCAAGEDLKIPNVLPMLLEHENFRLLHDITEGGRATEAGSHTGFHIDAHGLDTWITLQEGKMYPNIKSWLEILEEQWLHPKTTNEEVTKDSILRLLKPALEIIKSRIQRGSVEIFGGVENANSLVALIKGRLHPGVRAEVAN
ncbi:hypothetical protein FOXB_02702 [Fusarium oxysporum f. sp. conglutinans Fo5176]|uniref:Uncharacterized protein n=1 Tax=Fusarium oxysporum (strain Fo5176) TaxID=660025 RepID=F9F8H7_FUSOF|nr:hypothetical protein FOXB_02702 [Fusarium oxysporum f. sp. conglutinans Fo5176]